MGPLQRLFDLFHKQQQAAAKKSSGLTISGKAGGTAEKVWKPSDYTPPEDVRDNRYVNQPDEDFPEDDPIEDPKDVQWDPKGHPMYDPEPVAQPDPEPFVPQTDHPAYTPPEDPPPFNPATDHPAYKPPPFDPETDHPAFRPPTTEQPPFNPTDHPAWKDPEPSDDPKTDPPPFDPETDHPAFIPDDNTTPLPAGKATASASASDDSDQPPPEAKRNPPQKMEYFDSLAAFLSDSGHPFDAMDLAVLLGLDWHYDKNGNAMALPSLSEYWDQGPAVQARIQGLMETLYDGVNFAIGANLYGDYSDAAAKASGTGGDIFKIVAGVGMIALGIYTGGSPHAGLALFGKALTAFATVNTLTHINNALGMGSGDLLRAHNEAAFPGTNPWEQLSAGQASGIAPGAQEASGAIFQGRQQTHERNIQALQLDQDRTVEHNRNLASIVGQAAAQGPDVLNAAVSAYADNQTLQTGPWLLSQYEYEGLVQITRARLDLELKKWAEAERAKVQSQTNLAHAQTGYTDQRAKLAVVDTDSAELGLSIDQDYARVVAHEEYLQLHRATAMQVTEEGILKLQELITQHQAELADLAPDELKARIDLLVKQVDFFTADRINNYLGTAIQTAGAIFIGSKVVSPSVRAAADKAISRIGARRQSRAWRKANP